MISDHPIPGQRQAHNNVISRRRLATTESAVLAASCAWPGIARLRRLRHLAISRREWLCLESYGTGRATTRVADWPTSVPPTTIRLPSGSPCGAGSTSTIFPEAAWSTASVASARGT
jgi:hypothetical protein